MLLFFGIYSLVVFVQPLSCVQLFVTPQTAPWWASLSFTVSRSLLRLMSIESMMPSNHLILCRPLLLPSVFPSINVFPSELTLQIRWPNYWSFSFSTSPFNECSGLISFRIDGFGLLKFSVCFLKQRACPQGAFSLVGETGRYAVK